MANLKLKPCPFCGAKLEDRVPTVSCIRQGQWLVSHYCGPVDLSVCIDVYGPTKEEAILRWNSRHRKQKNT